MFVKVFDDIEVAHGKIVVKFKPEVVLQRGMVHDQCQTHQFLDSRSFLRLLCQSVNRQPLSEWRIAIAADNFSAAIFV